MIDTKIRHKLTRSQLVVVVEQLNAITLFSQDPSSVVLYMVVKRLQTKLWKRLLNTKKDYTINMAIEEAAAWNWLFSNHEVMDEMASNFPYIAATFNAITAQNDKALKNITPKLLLDHA